MQINVEIEIIPELFEAPVKVYPTISIKGGKGDSVSKKIKYFNPDSSDKQLVIISD